MFSTILDICYYVDFFIFDILVMNYFLKNHQINDENEVEFLKNHQIYDKNKVKFSKYQICRSRRAKINVYPPPLNFSTKPVLSH